MASLPSLARPWLWDPLLRISRRPFRAFADFHSADLGVEWIDHVTRVVRSGVPQVVIIIVALAWMLGSAIGRALKRSRTSGNVVAAKASKVRPLYEISAQITRAAALTLLVISALREPKQWLYVATVGSAFLLGIGRLLSNAEWRHSSLHQVNFLLATSLIVLILDDVLPLLKVGASHELGRIEIASLWTLGAAVFVALLTPREWTPPVLEKPGDYEMPDPVPTPEETCNWFSRYMTFEHMTPMIWAGWKRPLEMDDVPPLPWYDDPLVLLPRVLEARKRRKTTARTIFDYQRKEILSMATWIGTSYAFQLASPFAMYHLLQYIASPAEAVLHPALWLFIMFAGPLIKTLTFQQYVFESTRFLVRGRSALTQELYHRAMSSMELEEDVINQIATRGAKDEQESTTTSAGRLANLMSSDIDAVLRMRDSLLGVVGTPVSLVLTGYGFWKVTGWPGLLGMAFMAICGPLPVYLMKLMSASQRKIKMAQDSRISLITEYLGSIKAIKYFAWEDTVLDKVQGVRAKEQSQLWRVSVISTVINESTNSIPIVTLMIIFGLHVGVLDQRLTASIAFTTVSLVNNLRRNLGILSWVTRTITDGMISLDRLDRYYASTEPLTKYPEGPLRVQNATFRRSKNASFRLKDISVDFVESGLNVISGQSGSGKTSLLLAMLGELVMESGTVTSPGDIAYASQTPWLQNETIKDNILFHSPLEQARYDRVIEACCFAQDLEELSKGDQTEIGENGTILSGGQKSRVALARALYSKSAIIFLDDIFSALDAKTAAAVWELCFCSDMLKGRTIVLVTQVPWIASQADLHITMEAGMIQNIERNLGVTRRPVIPESVRVEGEASNGTALPDPKPAGSENKQDKVAEEMEASGKVSRLIVFKYLRYCGSALFLTFLVVSSLLYGGLDISASYWLAHWVDSYDTEKYVDIAYYAGIYAVLQALGSIMEGVEYLVYNRGAWNAARRLHRDLLRGVLNAPMAWWKDMPVGRVVNRFSRDIKSLDNNVGDLVFIVADMLISIFFSLAAASSILPIFILPALLSVLIGVLCGEMFTRTGVVLQRILRAAHSPVFSQFGDTMTGLTVIRAGSKMPAMFCDQLAKRMRPLSRIQEANFNINRWVAVRIDVITALVGVSAGIIAVYKASSLGAGLVGFSLSNVTGLSNAILYLVRCLNQLEVEFQGFQRVVEFISIEPEEKEDAAVTKPALLNSSEFIGEELPAGWPRTGSVELRHVTVRYDEDGPDILKDINLKFEAGERVAVVGRTGSGKSTLVLSLLRFTHIVSGQVLYDGVDITAIPRKKLRQALTIIPQEAVLFNGTLQTNLDPSGDVPVDVLESALQSCSGIASFQYRNNDDPDTETPNGGSDSPNGNESLDTEATEQTPLLSQADTIDNGTITPKIPDALSLATTVKAKGENFSHGQRQVLSLCRALIRKSKLMLLDEATASMDYETDRGVQVVLRKELNAEGARDRTLVTIAHRLRTIVDYDKVVVMGGGRVVEVGSPRELYHKKGQFFEMVKHSGEEEELARAFEGEETDVGSE
ncbi:P-loop containing nucleoside triphosphate hydrolase protein [Cercophora newfieldiana]|uniref:P-loop containing nucleoside triphosphate hydrolase protein n=1 Tax=Cercophora newfieldiana TaxID=92897 RepID=A0AA39Y2R0_9PEZI|nr:P-loop containing nucleoside triphosphate hydrolase protein [Cercophora newfieldiana]